MSTLHSLTSNDIPATWRLLPIGKILLDSQYGTNEPAVENGNTRVVGMKDIQDGRVITDDLSCSNLSEDECSSYLLSRGDLLLNRTNSYDLVGKVGLFDSDEEVAFASYLVRLKVDRTQVNPRFLNYWLNGNIAQTLIKKIATKAVSQANVNPTEFKKHCLVPVPSLAEQTAIAALLSTWDEGIEKTERLITAKEQWFTSLTQELIHNSTEGFRHFHLRDICEPVTRKNTVNELNVLTTSAQHGLISQTDYYNKSVSADDVRGYYLLKKGEFAYNRSSSNGYPYGAIKRLEDYTQGVLSTLYLCFSLKTDAPCDSDFIAHAFEAGLLNKQLVGVCQEGARSHGLLNITKTDFFGLKLSLPAVKEQQKIAAILTTARREIDLLNKQVKTYRIQKRGLMQKLMIGEWTVKPMRDPGNG